MRTSARCACVREKHFFFLWKRQTTDFFVCCDRARHKIKNTHQAILSLQVVPRPEVSRQSPPQDAVLCGPQEISGEWKQFQERRWEECREKEKICWSKGGRCVCGGWVGWTDLIMRTGVTGVRSLRTDTKRLLKSAAPPPPPLPLCGCFSTEEQSIDGVQPANLFLGLLYCGHTQSRSRLGQRDSASHGVVSSKFM